jgi:EmrB/QacA subfamily drug resistance transporter
MDPPGRPDAGSADPGPTVPDSDPVPASPAAVGPPADPPASTGIERKWLILSAVSLGTFMATLDGSIVNISLPKIQEAFGVDLATVEWVVIGYLLVVGTVLLPFGRLGEVLTFRRVYLSGFAVFTAASVLCGAAPGALALIVFRCVQGLGAGMLQAMGPAIVARTFGPRERGRALGFNAISVALGLTLGPALGGVLTEYASWRAIFFVNLPIGLLAIAWAGRILPPERRGQGQSFDLLGAALGSATVFCLLLALIQGQSWGWSSPAIVGLFAAFIVLGAAFLLVEWRTVQPMIDLNLFRIRAFAAGNASLLMAFGGLFTATFLLPFLLEDAAGYTPVEAGLLLLPIPISTAIVAPFSGTISDRVGSRAPASVGIGLLAVGLFSLTRLPMPFTVPDLVWRLVLIGVGQGIFMSPNSSAVLGSVPRARIGTASGTLAQMRVDGQALGIALSGAIVAIRLPTYLAQLGGGPAAQQEALALAIHDAFIFAAAICAFGILTSLVRGTARPGAADEAARRMDAAAGEAAPG